MRAGHDMRHITLHLMRDELPHASLLLAELEAFVPDTRPLLQDDMHEVPGTDFRNTFNRANAHLERLLPLLGDTRLDHPEEHNGQILRREQLTELDEWLCQAWRECAPYQDTLHKLNDQTRELDNLEETLRHFSHLDLDLVRLQGEHRYLDLYIGMIPIENDERLREALALNGYLLIDKASEGEHLTVVIAGPNDDSSSVNNVLSAAGFQQIDIPESFQTDPQGIRDELRQHRKELQAQRSKVNQRIADWSEKNRQRLQRARDLLDSAAPFAEVHDAARSQGVLAALQGWLPAGRIDAAQALLQQGMQQPFVLDVRRPLPKEYPLVPIPPMQNGLLRPFASLVRQYGVPRFGEFDPTLLFALSFAIMFGMMFGDVGHGAVFVAFGLLLRHQLGQFRIIFYAAGAMAMFFGLLYGSIFGVEHWLHPLWIAPLSDPIFMLTVALGWGMAFLTLGSVIAISNRLLAGNTSSALFDPGGVFSLLLYWALIGGLITLVQGDGFNNVSSTVIGLSLILLVGYQWHESDAPHGERALTVLIETFEIVNGYLASSLSFLRVAAFSLNHVALSMAVFTLADMLSGAGHWIMLLFGNLFIIVLEGVIVAIQTLRLEYYEGFSRYFYGDGQAFNPLHTRHRTSSKGIT